MCALLLPVITEMLHLLLSKCDVIGLDGWNSGPAASRDAGSKARTVGRGQDIDGGPDFQAWDVNFESEDSGELMRMDGA